MTVLVEEGDLTRLLPKLRLGELDQLADSSPVMPRLTWCPRRCMPNL